MEDVITTGQTHSDGEQADEGEAASVVASDSNMTCSSTASDGVFCRICHDSENILVTPCRCKGSVGYVHESCLVSWLIRSGNVKCELCETAYILRVKKAVSWIKRISKHDRAIVLVVIACTIFFLTTTVWLLWSFFSPHNVVQRNSELFMTCYILYGIMDLFCLGVFINELPHLRLVWKRWKMLRYDLQVLPWPAGQRSDAPAPEKEIRQRTAKQPETIELNRVTIAVR